MLFWRKHRAARIIFSLSFHLGRVTPDEAVEFLVHRVGHQRANAVAEVRCSFNGSYTPLYQATHVLGGTQMRSLYQVFEDSGRVTAREFHDTVMQSGPMPLEMLRPRLRGDVPSRGFHLNLPITGTTPEALSALTYVLCRRMTPGSFGVREWANAKK